MADNHDGWLSLYSNALGQHLLSPISPDRNAEALGSRAAALNLTVVELTTLHHTVLASLLPQGDTVERCVQTFVEAADFLEQCLLAFEHHRTVVKTLGLIVESYNPNQAHQQIPASTLNTISLVDYQAAEAALHQSEERYRTVVEDQTELICRFLPDGTLTFVNRAYCDYFNRTAADLVGANFLDLIPISDRAFVQQDLQDLSNLTPDNPTLTHEHPVLKPNDQIGWQEWINRAIFDAEGRQVELQAVGRDISDRKQAEIALQQLNLELDQRVQQRTAQLSSELRQKEILLREVHHRVRNNLQLISSMLGMQASTALPEVQRALGDSQSRVQAIALIHEHLHQFTNVEQITFDQYAQRLCDAILSFHQVPSRHITLTYRLQEAIFDSQTAISCGLLLNELVTNAIEHAFPDQSTGEIIITLTVSNTASSHAPLYTLSVQDNGIGITPEMDGAIASSLGMQIAHSLAQQLRGTLERDRSEGTCFRLTFPQ